MERPGRLSLRLESGGVAADIAVDLPRPRHRGAGDFGALEDRILTRLLDAG